MVTEACATRPELVDVPRLAAAATALRAQWRIAKGLKHALAPSLLDVSAVVCEVLLLLY